VEGAAVAAAARTATMARETLVFLREIRDLGF